MTKRSEYSFNRDIEKRLKGFKTYLKDLGSDQGTNRQKSNYTGYFLKWLEGERLLPEETRYNDMLNFIDHCRLEGKSKKHINSKLRSIRNYYDYLKENDRNIINPARNLYMKGIRHKVPSGIIAYQELEKLYNIYKTETLRSKRNRVILGLFIYQGISTGELQRMEPGHLKLKKGRIYIPGTRRTGNRTLDLKPFQVMEFYEYLAEIRPQILSEIYKPKPSRPAGRPGRKPDKINRDKLENQLFISINGSENIKNSVLHMFRTIRQIKPEIKHAKQIRASVIIHWLKNYNLRQVQYMAGHKYVSSTERYQLNNLDNLQSKLEEFHPLG